MSFDMFCSGNMHNNRTLIRPLVSPHQAHNTRYQIRSDLNQIWVVLLAMVYLTQSQEVITKTRGNFPIMHLPSMFLDFR